MSELLGKDAPPLSTAIYDHKRRYVTPKGQYYDHPAEFLERVKPGIFMPDLYPVLGNLDWNNPVSDDFLQNALDMNLLDKYKKYKQMILSQAKEDQISKFIPVVS